MFWEKIECSGHKDGQWKGGLCCRSGLRSFCGHFHDFSCHSENSSVKDCDMNSGWSQTLSSMTDESVNVPFQGCDEFMLKTKKRHIRCLSVLINAHRENIYYVNLVNATLSYHFLLVPPPFFFVLHTWWMDGKRMQWFLVVKSRWAHRT